MLCCVFQFVPLASRTSTERQKENELLSQRDQNGITFAVQRFSESNASYRNILIPYAVFVLVCYLIQIQNGHDIIATACLVVFTCYFSWCVTSVQR